MTQNKPYLVGITGGIATGKSTAINYIKLRGYEVIEFDEIGHNVLSNPDVIKKVSKKFGRKVLNKEGLIDRKKLGNIVFRNKGDLLILNSITHPKIYEIALEKINELKNEKFIFLDIPLLYETKHKFVEFYDKIDEYWVITSKEEVQTTRLMIRDGINIDEAKRKIHSQMQLKAKEKLADIVIYNNSDVYSLYEEVRIELINLEKRVN